MWARNDNFSKHKDKYLNVLHLKNGMIERCNPKDLVILDHLFDSSLHVTRNLGATLKKANHATISRCLERRPGIALCLSVSAS